MANLMKAGAMSPFKYYLPWEKPRDEKLALEQPNSIKVQYTAKVGGSSKPKDVTAHIVPDRGVCVESCLYWTLPQFQSNIVDRLNDDDQRDEKFLLSLFAKCLQGNAKVMFSQAHDECVVKAMQDNGSVDYNGLFKPTVQIYLEKVAGYKYIGDAAIRMLIGLGGHKKPLEMTPNTFFLHRGEIFGHATGGYLRVTVAIPMQKQLMEAAFMACPCTWQEKYAKVHEEVDADGKQLLSLFTAYHAADLRAGAISKIKKDFEDKKKKSSHLLSACQDKRRGGQRSGRDHPRDRHDGFCRDRDRGYDRYRRSDCDHRDHDSDRRDHREYHGKNNDRGYDKGKKQPYKKTAREEAHHAKEERRSSHSCSRSRSGSRTRSRSPSASSHSSAHSEGGYHNDRKGTKNGPACGEIDYSSDKDCHQYTHKSYKQGGYRSFDAPPPLVASARKSRQQMIYVLYCI